MSLKMEESFAIEVIKLSRDYSAIHAVDRISFNVKAGSVFGLLGPNGAGKSTTIKMLTTLLPPTSGTARIVGYDLSENPSRIRKNIGYVPQLISADGELTGYENLLLSAKLYGLSREVYQKRILKVLEFMGLSNFSHQLVNQYSGGMIRRLEIGQALLHEPKVLFLDEPTVGLDPASRRMLWELIQNWCKQFGTTILITTHDMEEADILCDIVAFMDLGRIVVMDSPDMLKATLGPQATLGDVFVKYTGTSINQGKSFNHVQEVRRSISNRD